MRVAHRGGVGAVASPSPRACPEKAAWALSIQTAVPLWAAGKSVSHNVRRNFQELSASSAVPTSQYFHEGFLRRLERQNAAHIVRRITQEVQPRKPCARRAPLCQSRKSGGPSNSALTDGLCATPPSCLISWEQSCGLFCGRVKEKGWANSRRKSHLSL